MPIRFELGIGVAAVHLGSEILEMIGNAAEAFAQSIDVAEPVDILTVTLLVDGRQRVALGGSQLFDAIKHTGARFVLLADITCRNSPVEHLVEMVRV